MNQRLWRTSTALPLVLFKCPPTFLHHILGCCRGIWIFHTTWGRILYIYKYMLHILHLYIIYIYFLHLHFYAIHFAVAYISTVMTFAQVKVTKWLCTMLIWKTTMFLISFQVLLFWHITDPWYTNLCCTHCIFFVLSSEIKEKIKRYHYNNSVGISFS